MAHPFLSEAWIVAVRQIRADAGPSDSPPTGSVRMNLVVTEVPFGDGTIHAHLDTTDGEMVVEQGHVDDPHATATLDYDAARVLLVDADPQAALQAFLGGRIKLQGDLTRALGVRSGPPDQELISRVQQITEP
jgi:hypothetical protein